MQVLRYRPERKQYRVRFYDANSQEEDCWVDVDAFTRMLNDHLHGNAEEKAAQLFQTRTLAPPGKFAIVESLAIICVFLVFLMMYLLRR